MRRALIACIVSQYLFLAVTGLRAGTSACFLRDGDRWIFYGDSITDNDTYRSALESVFRHFHPDATTAFLNRGMSGAPSSRSDKSGAEAVTVVSFMYGMNNLINSEWRYAPGANIGATAAAYRADMAGKARSFATNGAAVILMTPTLTDESYGHGFYELKGTRAGLKDLGREVYEAARQEKVFALPVQEEMEAFQDTLPAENILRVDGVHPSALGQYQIARSFWEHMNFPAPLSTGKREMGGFAPVPVHVALASKFLTSDRTRLEFVLASKKDIALRATWSLRGVRKTETLDIKAGTNQVWAPAIPASLLALADGAADRLIFDFRADDLCSVYIVDLCRTRVLHLKDGKVGGTVKAADGKTAGTWQIELVNKGILFSGEVADTDIRSDDVWPWARDGVTLWTDFRPPARFADVGLDSDVHMTILAMRDKPFFGCTPISWIGRGMHLAGDAGAAATATGYRWNYFVTHGFTRHRPVDTTAMDYFGFALIVVNNGVYSQSHTTPFALDKYANALMIVDINNKFTDDWITNVHLFGR